MTPAEKAVADRMTQLEDENRALKAKLESKNTITVKTAKYGAGTVSVYGLQRNPITLHVAQWPKLFAAQSMIDKFIVDESDGEIRCSGFANEVALKVLGLKTRPAATDKATDDRYKAEWDKAYAMAKADVKLIPSPRTV